MAPKNCNCACYKNKLSFTEKLKYQEIQCHAGKTMHHRKISILKNEWFEYDICIDESDCRVICRSTRKIDCYVCVRDARRSTSWEYFGTSSVVSGKGNPREIQQCVLLVTDYQAQVVDTDSEENMEFTITVMWRRKCHSTGDVESCECNVKHLKLISRLMRAVSDEVSVLCVSLRVAQETEIVNKHILCHFSPVFAKMLEKNKVVTVTRDALMPSLKIEDITMPIVKKMTHFLNTSRIENASVQSLLELYMAAHKYQIIPLQRKCAKKLLAKFTPTGDALLMLQRAEACGDGSFKRSVLFFMSIKLEEILLLPEWEKLLTNNPKLALMVVDFEEDKQSGQKPAKRAKTEDRTCAGSSSSPIYCPTSPNSDLNSLMNNNPNSPPNNDSSSPNYVPYSPPNHVPISPNCAQNSPPYYVSSPSYMPISPDDCPF